MAERYFTPDEANAALPEVRPLVEQMVRLGQALGAAEARRAEALTSIAGNGGGIPPSELARVNREADRAGRELGRCIEQIRAHGAEVKDVERGLIDFPALRDGIEVCLCWHLGEGEIGYWHGLEEGFAGRKPLPL